MPAFDVSAIASGTAIAVNRQNFNKNQAQSLPQRVAVIAQGESDVSYSSEKFLVTQGAKEVGAKYGYRSPAYAVARELWPVNGESIGSIPVEFIALQEGAGATASVGDITPTAASISRSSTFRAVVAGVPGAVFTIPKTTTVAATDISDWLESLRQSIANTLGLPVRVSHAYGTLTSAPGTNTGNGTISGLALASGGQPKAGTWTLRCISTAADAGTFTLTDPNGVIVSSSIVVAVANTDVAGLAFTIADGATDFAIGDTFTIEIPSTKLNVTSGWKGQSANDISLKIEGATDVGITWALTQMSGGATNPSVVPALEKIGDAWTTIIINALDPNDEIAFDAYQDWGGNPELRSGRWAPGIKKPAFVICGNNEVDLNVASAITRTRTTDCVNVVLDVPGSSKLPMAIAAEAVARVAKLANNNPPSDYGGQKMPATIAGTDAEQWTYEERDSALKLGVSTTELKSGIVTISDLVTMYAPEGEVPPSFRYVVDIVKLQNIVYNYNLVFDGPDWASKPLIPDDQATVNTEARQPKMAIADAFAIIDQLALAAIIADPKFSKETTSASVAGPKKLSVVSKFKLSANTNQKDIEIGWDFYYGN